MTHFDDDDDLMTEQEFLDGCHTDPRLCAYCGEAFEVEHASFASFILNAGSFVAQGDLMFSRCAKDGVLQISGWLDDAS